jgi:Ca2+-binding EF-hand superfamily protein
MRFFITHILTPYLSSVFTSIKQTGKKLEYIELSRLKLYLNLPPIIQDSVCNLINTNSDERIDHDEFVKFFLSLIASSVEKRFLVAFKIFDREDHEYITRDDISIILKNLPYSFDNESFYGISHDKSGTSTSLLTLSQHLQMRTNDSLEIESLLDEIFDTYDQKMFFSDFCNFTKMRSSDLVVSIYQFLQSRIPCIRVSYVLLAHYKAFLS